MSDGAILDELFTLAPGFDFGFDFVTGLYNLEHLSY